MADVPVPKPTPERPRGPGRQKQLILQTILERPGVSAPELAEVTGIKRTIVAATINRLKRGGELEAYDEGVRVPFVARA